MAAHLREIPAPKCYRCTRQATQTLHNTRNEPIADYCENHAQEALKDFHKGEKEGERQ